MRLSLTKAKQQTVISAHLFLRSGAGWQTYPNKALREAFEGHCARSLTMEYSHLSTRT